jgi:hypothetical protein
MVLDPFAILSFILANLVLFIAVFFILALVLGALFLMLGLRVVNGQNRGFGAVFVTVLIGVVLSLIPCLGCILYWYIIKVRHQTGWGGAIGAWIIAGLIPILIVVGVVVVIFLPTVLLLLFGP